MSKESEEFFKIMLHFFPSTHNQYKKSIDSYGKLLETTVIEDIFMPEIIELLKENKNIELIKNIFDYFEKVSNCKDSHLINVFSITVLEILGNDKTVFGLAQKYMGPTTMQLQIEADRELGRL